MTKLEGNPNTEIRYPVRASGFLRISAFEFHPGLLEIIDDDFFADPGEDAFDEGDVAGMGLVGVLRFLVRKNQIESDLVRLVHDRAVAGGHFADVVVHYAWDGLEIFVRAGDQFIGGGGIVGVRPEDDDVREHMGCVVFSRIVARQADCEKGNFRLAGDASKLCKPLGRLIVQLTIQRKVRNSTAKSGDAFAPARTFSKSVLLAA
jgi:hypothetical protein